LPASADSAVRITSETRDWLAFAATV
jgi:hypothetical protein